MLQNSPPNFAARERNEEQDNPCDQHAADSE
jgi:hypothetical protein